MRNKCEEVDTVKESTMSITWQAHKRAQKDDDSMRAKKRGKNHFGCNRHASADKHHKSIRKAIIILGAVADTTVFEELLGPDNTSSDVYVNPGRLNVERDATLVQAGDGSDPAKRPHYEADLEHEETT